MGKIMQLQSIIPSDFAMDTWLRCHDALLALEIAIPDNFQQQAERVFSLSEFVAKQCLKNPQHLVNLIQNQQDTSHLFFQSSKNRLIDDIKGAETEQHLATLLRQFRNQQMIVIYWHDLLDIATVKDTCSQVSTLADLCIREANNWLYNHLCREMKITENESLNNLIVIGMGKLGGNELNVSSDIDLIFCYQESIDPHQNGKQNNINEEKFFNRLGQKLIKSLDQITVDGFVFRVDMRLRPYGDSGPLVMSFSALEEYYQDQGRDWERFALIKARIITGSDAEKKLFQKLLRPFIFRRYIDFSVLESPRQMKNLIDQELRRRNLSDNIKLGPGGIREVEFIAQALQLIHGGRDTRLQCRSIFKSLPRLAELKLLPTAMVNELLDCYLFLRKVEHRLQAVKDQQTQNLPTDELQRQYLALGLNFKDWLSLRNEISSVMEKIHRHFNNLFRETKDSQQKEGSDFIFNDIWQGFLSLDVDLVEIIRQAGFDDAEGVNKLLVSFQASSSVRHMGPRGAKRLDQLMPDILQVITSRHQKGSAKESLICGQTESLKRILRLLSSILTRTAYLELLGENKGALDQMIHLCSSSARIAEQISDYPYVLDELINPSALLQPPEISQLPDMLRQLLCRIPDDDQEYQIDCLREFKQINFLRATAADIAGVLSIQQLSQLLTAIAETVIESVVHLAWQHMNIKYGSPQSTRLSVEKTVQGFAIIAYGKLGGGELGYGSDLDLVFLYEADKGLTDGEKPIENAVFYMRLAQKIIHFLNIRTRSGVLYEVDMRLRPSGNSGLLVSHIDAFTEYQNESAWTWEHQALIRARCILGSTSLRAQFEKIRTRVLCRERADSVLRNRVISMREKMRDNLLEPNLKQQGLFNLKQTKGGIADIEFLTQYLVLKLANTEPDIIISRNTSELLSCLAKRETLVDSGLEKLVAVYTELRKMLNRNFLQNLSSNVALKDIRHIDVQGVNDLWKNLLGRDLDVVVETKGDEKNVNP